MTKADKLEIIKESTNSDSIGWLYDTAVPAAGARKLVSLRLDGVEWVSIRTWIEEEQCWYDGSNRELAWVVAWKDLPTAAQRNWVDGKLTSEFAKPEKLGITKAKKSTK